MDPHEYDLSGFTVGIVDRPAMIGPERVQDGDVLIGLASSGLHSNGYSLARKVCTEGKTLYELTIPREELNGDSVLDALLEPTRIYVRSIRSVLLQCPGAIHSLAHITGGGITENLNRALPSTLDAEVHVGTWNMAPIIPWVCRAAHLDETEALKTFNMGLGMIVAVAPQKVEEVVQLLADAGEEVYLVGQVTPGTGKVVYTDKDQLFVEYADDEDEE
jgi:phosphoribosylformylglycinamidine cyclo-ligase